LTHRVDVTIPFQLGTQSLATLLLNDSKSLLSASQCDFPTLSLYLDIWLHISKFHSLYSLPVISLPTCLHLFHASLTSSDPSYPLASHFLDTLALALLRTILIDISDPSPDIEGTPDLSLPPRALFQTLAISVNEATPSTWLELAAMLLLSVGDSYDIRDDPRYDTLQTALRSLRETPDEMVPAGVRLEVIRGLCVLAGRSAGMRNGNSDNTRGSGVCPLCRNFTASSKRPGGREVEKTTLAEEKIPLQTGNFRFELVANLLFSPREQVTERECVIEAVELRRNQRRNLASLPREFPTCSDSDAMRRITAEFVDETTAPSTRHHHSRGDPPCSFPMTKCAGTSCRGEAKFTIYLRGFPRGYLDALVSPGIVDLDPRGDQHQHVGTQIQSRGSVAGPREILPLLQSPPGSTPTPRAGFPTKS